jgi:hypothetical protein
MEDGAAPATITWIQPFVQQTIGPAASDSFTAQAQAAGDAIVLHVECASVVTQPTVTVTAPGWTFEQLEAPAGGSGPMFWSAAFGAFAPDTLPTTVTVTWSSMCNFALDELGDEFANIDPAGGASTFDAHLQTSGTGDCSAAIAIGHDHDAVWAACTSQGMVMGVGAGYTKGADDSLGDLTEYRVTSDLAGTLEQVQFPTDGMPWLLSVVSLKPR